MHGWLGYEVLHITEQISYLNHSVDARNELNRSSFLPISRPRFMYWMTRSSWTVAVHFLAQGMKCCGESLPGIFYWDTRISKLSVEKCYFRGREKIRLGFSCFSSSPNVSCFTWSQSALLLNLCNKTGIHISLWYVCLWYFAEDLEPMFPLKGVDFLENYISHKARKCRCSLGHTMPLLLG